MDSVRQQLENNKAEYQEDLERLKERYKREYDQVVHNKETVLGNLEEKYKNLRKQ